MAENKFLVIESVTKDNRKFRPSDWVERLASLCGEWSSNGTFHFNPEVVPTMHNGNVSLKVNLSLKESNPDLFLFFESFANDNNLVVHEIKGE